MSKFRDFLTVMKFLAAPALLAVGVPAALVPVVMHGLELAEVSHGTGAEKKALALDTVRTGIAAVNAVRPGTLDANIVSVVDDGIDATVGAINAITKRPIRP